MRQLIVSTFPSLDGIMQAPGGPEEDPPGGFTLGGWLFGFGDESMDISASGFDGKDREVVLGRRTYEIFEAYRPYQPDDHCRRRHGRRTGVDRRRRWLAPDVPQESRFLETPSHYRARAEEIDTVERRM